MGFIGIRWNGMEERRETFVDDHNEIWDGNVKKGLLYLIYFFFLKFHDHDAITVKATHTYHQQRRQYHQQKTALVHACLNKIQYQQLKSNWTKFTFQEYLIGSLLSLIVIIPVTILLLSTSLPTGLPYSLTTLISIITLLHIVWGVFDIYDTTSHYNIYIRLFLGLVIVSGLVIPLFFIPNSYHLVYSELSTIVYTFIILLASFTRGILGYKLYPVDNLYLRDLLHHTGSDQDESRHRYTQPYYQQSESLFELPIPLQHKKKVSFNDNSMNKQQQEYYTNYYYKNGKIISAFFDDERPVTLPPQFQPSSTPTAPTVPPLSSLPPQPLSSSKYRYSPASTHHPSQTSYPYLSQDLIVGEEDQYSMEDIPVRPSSTAIQIYGRDSEGGEKDESSIRFIQVMRVACIFFEKLKGMLIFWSTLLLTSFTLLFLLNLPFFFHRKQFPSLVMRIDKSLTEELPLLNRTTVSGFYVQNQTVAEVYFDKKYYHLVNKVKIQGHLSLDNPKNTYHLDNLYDNYSLNSTNLIIPIHDYYDWYYATFNTTDVLLSEKLSYATNTIQLNYPRAPSRYYLYVDTVLLNPWLVETIHARGKEAHILFSEEATVGRPSLPSPKKRLRLEDIAAARASELDEAVQSAHPITNNTTDTTSSTDNSSTQSKSITKSKNKKEKIAPGDQIHIFNHILPGEDSLSSPDKQNVKPGYYPDISNKPHGVTGTGDKSKDLDLEKEKWAIAIISVTMSYLVFSSVYIGFNIKKVSTTSYSYYRKQLRQSHVDPQQDHTTIMDYHEKKMLSIFIECIAALGWLLFVIGWGNNKSLLVIPLPHFLYILGFLGLLSSILFITVTIATHHILISILHCAVEILVILSAGSVYHQVYLYYPHTSSLKIVLIGVIIYATCKILSVGIYMFRWKRSTLENDLVIVISLAIGFIGSVAFLIGFGRINLVYHVFNSFSYLLYYIFAVVSMLSIIFLVYSCLQSIKFVNSLTCIFLLMAIFSAGGPLTDSYYSLTHHCKYEEEDFDLVKSPTLFTIIPGCSYQHQFILAGLLIFIIGEAVCFFYHHCYPIYESAARQYKDYKENFLLNHDVASINRDDPQFSVFKHIKRKGWLNSLFTILCFTIVITSLICLTIYAWSPHTFTMVFNTSCVTYTLAGVFYPILLYFVISRNNRFCFIICETLYFFALVTSGYISFWCLIHMKSLDKGFVFLFLFSFIFIVCLVTVHTISHLYLHHFTNGLQRGLFFMIKLLSLVGLLLFTVGICRQYQKLLSGELIPGVLLMIFGLLSLICWFEYVVIQIVSLNLFNSLFISVSLICCGFFIISSSSEIANSVNHLLKYIGVLIYCIPIFVSEIFRCWKGSSSKSSIIKASSRIKLFPIGDAAMFMNTTGGLIRNQPLTVVDLLTLFKGSKVLCFMGNLLISLIISGYLLFLTSFSGLFKYFNVDFTAHIIFLLFGFLNIVLLTLWYYSIKHNKTVFCILSMISIGSNFSAYNIIKWILANRKDVDQFNSTPYLFHLMLIGCLIFIMATVFFQVLSFVWKKIELVNYLKSFYLIISAVLLSSGFIMLIIYVAANANKLTSSLKISIYILLGSVFSKVVLVLLEYLVHWTILKYLSEIVLWCLPLQSGSVCIDVYISLFKCSQSNCKSLPFTIIFGIIIIFFGSLLLLYWKIFRCSRFHVKHLAKKYGLHHINIDGGYEPFSTIRNNIYVYPTVTISIALLAFAYLMFVYNYESFRDSNELVMKEHLLTFSLYSYTDLLSIIFLVLYLFFELTWFGIVGIVTVLLTLITAGSNINLSLLIVHHAYLTQGKLNLVMMITSIALSTLLYLVIVVLLLKRIGIELDVIIGCLRRIKYRCKKIMSYKLSIFTFPNSSSSPSSSSSSSSPPYSYSSSSRRNKNKQINIINVEEEEEEEEDSDEDHYKHNKKNYDGDDDSYSDSDSDSDDERYRYKKQHHFDYDSDHYYAYDKHSRQLSIKKNNSSSGKSSRNSNGKGKEKEDQQETRFFINQFKHQVNDLINVNYMNKKMIKKRFQTTKPRIYYERIFKSIPIVVFGIGILILFSGLLVGYKGEFSTVILNDSIYLESETYTPPYFHWILFFVAVGAYAFITIEYLCYNFQFFKILSLLLSMITYHCSGVLLFSIYRVWVMSELDLKANPHYSKDFNRQLMKVCGTLTLLGILIINICIAIFYVLKFINWVAFSTSHPEYTDSSKKKRRVKICCSIDMNDSPNY
ncbi:hypothetical protein PIROE2DRAFT_64779 [Piromyces sp. E2]|nr:hypothetical protein PIROE2DRAFT_64779 [Piromyces sp. E2]|eukprot:OUM57845.1 hypothetical protein PIROE2DRAFT_64779 [Piromyces sp. E2]